MFGSTNCVIRKLAQTTTARGSTAIAIGGPSGGPAAVINFCRVELTCCRCQLTNGQIIGRHWECIAGMM